MPSQSLSFERAAEFYDRTREFPQEVAERGIAAILDAAGPRARILDVGTGSGRISVPLLRHGARLIGCDISRRMMALLRERFPAAQLAEADASRLPFPAGGFDAILTCHVMHLVAPWREALLEYRRVIKRGGIYIDVQTERSGAESPGQRIKDYWRGRVESRGASTRRPGVEDEEELREALMEIGATVQQVEIGRYSRTYVVQDVVEGIADRLHSSTWVVPDDIFGASVVELRNWVAREYGDPNEKFEEESVFTLNIARFELGEGRA